MTTTTGCRRKQRRRTTSGSDSTCVEIKFPQPEGRKYELALVDVSVSGLSFALEEELLGLESGTDLTDVVVRMGGDCEIHGELVVMHVTPRGSGRWLCGALFFAATDTDLIKWRSAIAGVEAAG